MSATNRTVRQNRDRQLLAATQKYLMQLATIPVAGKQYTPAQIVAAIQHDSDIADAATQARATFLNAAKTDEEQRSTMGPFFSGLRAFVENMFTDPNVIAEFGYAPRKVSEPDAATKAAAVAKRAATRKARGTLGKKQKAKIKGTVSEDGAAAAVVAGPTTPPVNGAAKTGP